MILKKKRLNVIAHVLNDQEWYQRFLIVIDSDYCINNCFLVDKH